MRYDQLLLKTEKEVGQADAVNATLLMRGGFIEQVMAGVWAFLPLGWRVLNKIENIIRQEMDELGAEMLMPALVPTALWEKTGRLATVDVLMTTQPANDAARAKHDATYVLSPTHEEVITPIALTRKLSYKDLPFAVYQIQTKFRNEARPKSGLLRGREFRMKDLYSFHANDDDRRTFYERVKEVYAGTFKRLGLGEDTVIALASGGDFTKDFSHEFDTRCATGEDAVYYDEANDLYYNAEVAPETVKRQGNSFAVSEVGNIFPLGTKFSEAFGYYYLDARGQRQLVHMASYGIGSSRVMGVLVEKHHDQAGIIWPAAVAPFTVHLVALNTEDANVRQQAEAVYQQCRAENVEVLFDDRRAVSAGEKLADADLLGIPCRAVISKKTGEQIEVKRRGETKTSLIAHERLKAEAV